MIRTRRGTVIEVRARPGAAELTVEIDGARAHALAYPDLVGVPAPGEVVLLNTTAVDLGLGTGGVHFVIAIEGRDPDDAPLRGHAMKLRYTPLQTSVDAVEETHRDAIDAVETLDATPVIAAGLHSALTPALLGARAADPDLRIAYVMTDAAALHLGVSRTVPALRDAGLLDTVITAGQSVGGDLEAVTVFGALAAARAVARADVVVVAMGPGNLGTGSRWGFAAIETAAIVDAVAAMGGRAIVAPRLSFADPRDRHRGASHHTVTALSVALARAEVTLPVLEAARAAQVRAQLAPIADRHTIVEVDLGPAEDALRASPVPLRSMGRAYDDDPDYFRAAAAAGVHAARARHAPR